MRLSYIPVKWPVGLYVRSDIANEIDRTCLDANMKALICDKESGVSFRVSRVYANRVGGKKLGYQINQVNMNGLDVSNAGWLFYLNEEESDGSWSLALKEGQA